MGKEFEYVGKWIRNEDGTMKMGVDLGCGTNRLSMEVLAIDAQDDRRYAHADIVKDVADLEIKEEKKFGGRMYSFKDGELDFIFSSHCLEDFADIKTVFRNWWKKIKINGLMILLLPDMEPCECELCKSEQQIEYRNHQGMSARYWTLEDYQKTGKGNPAHKTNVGKKFINVLLQDLKEHGDFDYQILQQDTIPHNVSCSVDFVIKKLK